MDELFSELVKVDRKRKIETAKIFKDAFMTDPISCYLFSDEEKRAENLYNYFLFRVTYGIKFGHVFATSENYEGAAVWVFGKKSEMTVSNVIFAGGMRMFMKIDRKLIDRMLKVGNYTTVFRDNLIQPPYWQLAPIGVKPKHQGKGFASKP